MRSRKILSFMVLVSMLASLLLMSGVSPASAQISQNPSAASNSSVTSAPSAPISAVDETKVPHYFGPYPNWANSPLALADVTVSIVDTGTVPGSGATASATVGANGAVTGLTITNPGSGYTQGTTSVAFTSTTGIGASATVTVNIGGSVVAVNVAPGAGGAAYTTPQVTFTGGGAPTVPATAVAYGGVNAVALTSGNIAGVALPTVDFDLPDGPNGVPATGHVTCVELNCVAVAPATTVTVNGVVVDNHGSGYSVAPGVVVRDGTQFKPIRSQALKAGAAARVEALTAKQEGPLTTKAASPAAPGQIWSQTATLSIQNIAITNPGAGYTVVPSVAIVDVAPGAGAGAIGTAVIDTGAITGITLVAGGSGYITAGGIKKFQDGLPGLGSTAANNLGQYIPVGVADITTFPAKPAATPPVPAADYYVIGLVEYREQMSSSLPPVATNPTTHVSTGGTLLRGYVQLSTSVVPGLQLPLYNPNGSQILMPDGTPARAVDKPNYLGPVIVATRDRPVRIVFYNLLPKGAAGDLFLPVDGTMMGAGMGPMGMAAPTDAGTVTDLVRNPACTEDPKGVDCFKDNRATLHLHGGTTPWISDGTAHQWITPANENTAWPQGVSVANVPDMVGAGRPAGVPDCTAATDGCQTFYYTNQQSARLLFYHDHAWGITRLNVYAGEAAGYVITDDTEKKLTAAGGPLAGMGVGTPLVIQDRTFVSSPAQMAQQDPTWDYSRWGGFGDLWYHHVYMPAQNPGDPSGMSSFGRWMYGPWFWPPAGTALYQPIANPYYNMDPKATPPFSQPLAVPCNLDVPATWQYQTDPFCEPQLIPATPNISVGMEQFNDTPLVNGTAYPKTTVEPKSYRFRILNAANDRFWNLQWYVADATGTEVALKAAEVAAAQLDPNVAPTPDTAISPVGPSWIQIGSEGGFLPAPTVVPNQPITWITDPTRFDVGNVDQHSLLLAPAERADVIVDFSKFVGKTLILYNDAPAAFPARVSSYDYYTGGPDLSPAGAPSTLPGYGPNTRTIMQVTITGTVAAPFNLTALQNAFKHHADGSGVFESGQHPIIVGQAAYNSAYGTSFASGSWCSAPGSSSTTCDGLARISEQGGDLFGFNTLKSQTSKMQIKLEPKALHDEMNSASFDEFGRMTANLGLEAVPANPAAQNIILYPFVNPPTEIIDGTNLPSAGIKVTPISSGADGTQIWKMTHNGVDTHPIHFHLFDVQVLNRVTWDNIIIPTEPSELGWKDTVRISPLEDTIVALRPIIPAVPFEVPNSVRMLNPMMPANDTSMFNPVDTAGNPTANIVNQLVNFGWEYVYHCHILSHEEMDMMRPVTLAMPPNKPSGLTQTHTANSLRLTWSDNSINETAFVIQRTSNLGVWSDLATIPVPLNQTNIHQSRFYDDNTFSQNAAYQYRVVAQNTVGYGGEFPGLTVSSPASDPLVVGTKPNAPTGLTATLQAGPQVRLAWTDAATNEGGFSVQRSTDGVTFTQVAIAPARNNTGSVTYIDTTVTAGAAPIVYTYRVAAVNGAGLSAFTTPLASVTMPVLPAAPTLVSAILRLPLSGNIRTIDLRWNDNATNETGFTIQRATSATGPWTNLATLAAKAGTSTNILYTDGTGKKGNTYYFRILANNGVVSNPSLVRSVALN